MDPKFRSRKLFMALFLEFLATALLITDFVDETVWQNITMLVGGAYLASQAFVDKQKKVKTKTYDDYWQSLDP